jgi:hypothetical protein
MRGHQGSRGQSQRNDVRYSRDTPPAHRGDEYASG